MEGPTTHPLNNLCIVLQAFCALLPEVSPVHAMGLRPPRIYPGSWSHDLTPLPQFPCPQNKNKHFLHRVVIGIAGTWMQSFCSFAYFFVFLFKYAYRTGSSLARTTFKINCSLNHSFIHSFILEIFMETQCWCTIVDMLMRPRPQGISMVSPSPPCPNATDSVRTVTNNKVIQRRNGALGTSSFILWINIC